jgi:hypothetical protein
MYHSCDSLNATDRTYFDVPIETILRKPTRSLKHWIQQTEKYVKDSLTRTALIDQRNTQPITKFFPIFRPQTSRRPNPNLRAPEQTPQTRIPTSNPVSDPPRLVPPETSALPPIPPKPNPPVLTNDILSLLTKPP